MTDFGGWEMPLWYPTGGVREHMAVIERAGVFDVGHMDILRIKGTGAFGLLQACLTRDISGLKPGACAYSLILNESGHAVDDSIIYNLGGDSFILIVNAGMGPAVKSHLEKHNAGKDAEITDEAGRFGKIDLQGPASPAIVKKILARGTLDGLKYFNFRGDYANPDSEILFDGGIPALLSRTGYTGELGFEIIVPRERAAEVWNLITEAGKDDVIPCGLAARDSLRTGAMLPLSHQDIGAWPFVNTPWDFALPRAKSGGFTKDFVGSKIYDSPIPLYTYAYCGFDPRKVETAGAAVLSGDAPDSIGVVSTCAIDMAIGRADGKIFSAASPDKPDSFKPRGLVCGFVRVNRPLETGAKIILKDARRSVEVEIVKDIRPHRTARAKL
jgi:aminomethyltransferase